MAKKDKQQDQVDENEAETEIEVEAEKASAEIVDDGLVEVHKDGETLRIHPATVKAHHAAGWKVL